MFKKISTFLKTLPKIIRILLIILIISSLAGAGIFYLKPEKTLKIEQKANNDTTLIEQKLAEIGAIDPDDLLYDKLIATDIKIYPSSWTNKYFSKSELKNTLISDSASDADSDGLSNQQEYYYGSNPKNKYSFCEILPDKSGPLCQKTDRELIDANLSPLTGLKISPQKPQKVKKTDRILAEKNSETAYNNAANQGVDMVQLYQKSMLVNFEDQIEKIEFIKGEVTRENILNFLTARKKIIEDFTNQNTGLDEFTFSYLNVDPKELKNMLTRYDAIYTKLSSVAVPPFAEKIQKYHLFALNNIRDLLKFRIEESSKIKIDIEKQALNYSQEFKDKSAEISLKVGWAYRRLQEEEQIQAEVVSQQFNKKQ
jgi:hypothetical protein